MNCDDNAPRYDAVIMNLTSQAFYSGYQHTLSKAVQCEGVGLHSGKIVQLTIKPAAVNTGIRFIRQDIAGSQSILASAAFVSETRLGTTLRGADGTSVATVEHLMAALWGMGVDNAEILLDGMEVPIMDGSSEPFMEMLALAGLRRQKAARRYLKVTSPISIAMGESRLELLPEETSQLQLEIDVEYKHPEIGRQSAHYDFRDASFSETLAEARTFGFAHEVEMMKQLGLARGGSLQNAIVLDETRVLNPEGLRSEDEFVRHKALDLVGDLFLSGYRVLGKIKATKPGHQINTALALALQQQPHCWEVVEGKAQDSTLLMVSSYPRYHHHRMEVSF